MAKDNAVQAEEKAQAQPATKPNENEGDKAQANEGQVEVKFNPATLLSEYTLSDGTKLVNGSPVSESRFENELKTIKLNGNRVFHKGSSVEGGE